MIHFARFMYKAYIAIPNARIGIHTHISTIHVHNLRSGARTILNEKASPKLTAYERQEAEYS